MARRARSLAAPLNHQSLQTLIYTRAGFVDEARVLRWLDQLHAIGDFYDWRSRYAYYPGLRLLDDQEALERVRERFEASMATARAQIEAN